MGRRWLPFASLILALLSLPNSSSLADDEPRYESKMSCGGENASIILECPEMNVGTPYDCQVRRVDIGSTKFDNLEIVVKWLNSSELVPVGWTCHSEGQNSAIEFYFSTGGNCDECEKFIWVDIKGQLLDEEKLRSIFSNVPDAWHTNWTWLNNPKEVR